MNQTAKPNLSDLKIDREQKTGDSGGKRMLLIAATFMVIIAAAAVFFTSRNSAMIESLLIALVGGVLGCLAALPFNGFTAGTMNWQTFSHLAFAFRITPGLLVAGMIFALLMGFVGGVLPAIRAARLQVAPALREL